MVAGGNPGCGGVGSCTGGRGPLGIGLSERLLLRPVHRPVLRAGFVAVRPRDPLHSGPVAGHLPEHPAEPAAAGWRCSPGRSLAVRPGSIVGEDRHRAGPSGQGRANLDREAGHLEAGGRKRFQRCATSRCGSGSGSGSSRSAELRDRGDTEPPPGPCRSPCRSPCRR